jgi:hypothetical protein
MRQSLPAFEPRLDVSPFKVGECQTQQHGIGAIEFPHHERKRQKLNDYLLDTSARGAVRLLRLPTCSEKPVGVRRDYLHRSDYGG